MVRDEADLVEGWARHTVGEVDHLLVADNRSIDGTREILAKLVAEGLPITLTDDLDPAFRQSEKMSRLAARAVDMGAKWIVPVDADELWYSPHGRIRDVLPELLVTVCLADLYDHFRTGLDVDDPDPFKALVWRMRDPAEFRKVAFRWSVGAKVHQGNHGVDLPADHLGNTRDDILEIRHFPFRSPAQHISKVRNGGEALGLTDLPADSGAHWRAHAEILARHGEEYFTRTVHEAHYLHPSPTDRGMIRDPAPYRRWEP
jgi:hypothetical protein